MQIHDGSDDPSLRGAPREWLPPPLHPFLPRTAPGPLGAARVQLGALWDSGFPTSGTRARFTSSEIQQGCMQRCRHSPSFRNSPRMHAEMQMQSQLPGCPALGAEGNQ